jgi:hypothetical protein
MNSLSKYGNLLRQFPHFELSYETVSHKKVSSSIHDSIAVAISTGRKYFIWYTHKYGSSEDACYLVGLDKDKQICSVEPRPSVPGFSLGTVVYCTLYEMPDKTPIFLAEDIYYFRGINLSNLCFGDRIGFLCDYVRDCKAPDIALPLMWYAKDHSSVIPAEIASKIGYQAHHIQYREIHRVSPYINVIIPKRGTIPSAVVAPISSATVAQKMTAAAIMNPIPNFDFTKPAFRYPAVFNVTADPQLDLYHLYAYGGPGVAVYCGLAGVQSFKTSIFMNRIFRRIRENEHLDYAEESEDEADFENLDANKFVNLDAVVSIECVFNQKHKKWIPVRVSKEKLIHIEKLVSVGRNQNFHNRR